MRYHNITKDDMLNGEGIRVVLWVAGCEHACEGCHNPITWDEHGGLEFDEAAKQEIFAELEHDYVSGITLSGGDPLYQVNACLELVKKVKELNSDFDIIIYTGFTFEELANNFKKNNDLLSLLKLSDILIDGKYEDSLRDLTLRFRGSSNQRVINLKKTFLEEKIVLENW